MNTIKNLFPEELHKYLPTLKGVLHSILSDYLIMVKISVETSSLDDDYKRRLLGYLKDTFTYFDELEKLYLYDVWDIPEIIQKLHWDKTTEGYDFWFDVMKGRKPLCIDSIDQVHKIITNKVQDLCDNAESGETITFSEPVYYQKKDYECVITCYVRYNSETERDGQGFVSGSYKEDFEIEVESAILIDEDGNETGCKSILGSLV